MTNFTADWDTRLGGAQRAFPSTCWAKIVGGFGTKSPESLQAAEDLARHYWKPVYAFVRRKWSKSNEDAKDLTQDFFIWMMEGDFLGRADPSRGRFRAFLKVALENYLGGEHRKRQTLKRGGDRSFVAIDAGPEGFDVPGPADATPEQALDRAWKGQLLGRSVELLRDSLAKEGKTAHFEMFKAYYLEDAGDQDYGKLAAVHGVKESDVDHFLRQAKGRFRDILANLVAETVEGEEDLEEELRLLFGGGIR